MIEACNLSLDRGVTVGRNVEVAGVIEVLEAVGTGEFCGTGVVGVDGKNEADWRGVLLGLVVAEAEGVGVGEGGVVAVAV